MVETAGYAHAATLATADPDLAVRLASELREAHATIERVRALHRSSEAPVPPEYREYAEPSGCPICSRPWPCGTIRAIDPPDGTS
jgi:hypothetical protein